jgi:hypothetical protein
MQDITYEKLKIAIVSCIMNNDTAEPIEEKMKVLTDLMFFIDNYKTRNKGYQLRKENDYGTMGKKSR